MKIRSGFVSNSSSSSFTCDISGSTESGMDMGLSDAGMVQSNWGTYCEHYLLKRLEKIFEESNNLDSEDDGYEDSQYELRYNIPDKYCPLFNLTHITDADLLRYCLHSLNLTRDVACNTIRAQFKNLQELREAVK